MQANSAYVPFSLKDLDDGSIDKMDLEELKSVVKQCRDSQIHMQHQQQLQLQRQPVAPQESAEVAELKRHYYEMVNDAIAEVSQDQDFSLKSPHVQKKRVLRQLEEKIGELTGSVEEMADMKKSLRAIYDHTLAGDEMMLELIMSGKLPMELVPILVLIDKVGSVAVRNICNVSEHIKRDASQYSIDKLNPYIREEIERAMAQREEDEEAMAAKLRDLLRLANVQNPQASSGPSSTETFQELLSRLKTLAKTQRESRGAPYEDEKEEEEDEEEEEEEEDEEEKEEEEEEEEKEEEKDEEEDAPTSSARSARGSKRSKEEETMEEESPKKKEKKTVEEKEEDDDDSNEAGPSTSAAYTPVAGSSTRWGNIVILPMDDGDIEILD